VLGNPLASHSRDRRAGLLEETQGGGFALDEVEGGWTADRARDAVFKWLVRASARHAWPDAAVCQNDEMAIGAREALARAATEFGRPALAELPVTGGDGLPEAGQKWVAEGKLTATIVVPPVAGVAVDLLLREWCHGRPMPPRTVLPVTPHPAIEDLAARRRRDPARHPPPAQAAVNGVDRRQV
jgi:ABC-type sugar transport system substrate-binding protein